MLAFQGSDLAIGYVDPPVEVVARADVVTVRALNARGRILLPALARAGRAGGDVLSHGAVSTEAITLVVPRQDDLQTEEDRTRHAGVFAALRAIVAAMRVDDPWLGLFGAYGYDLFFQVERLERHQDRDPADRELVLHVPDEILEFDLRRDEAVRYRYEFTVDGVSTGNLPRATAAEPYSAAVPAVERDHRPGEYAEVVRRAMRLFRSGDLFEVVPSQVFAREAKLPPSRLFQRLRERNPSPYSLLMNLGEHEYLVGASPEMFVNVRQEQGHPSPLVESAPISGTIARGRDALEDAARVRELLGSAKDETELTMCTDVDRNDKAKVCLPGTVEVKARRRIKMYSTVIHTMDHVVGRLRPDRDAVDALLAHLWAVTVTGAPKLAAVQFLEREERSPRRWYGGAVGRLGFDGSLTSVLTLRTIQIKDGVASVRAGATLLHESDPGAEEAETELKAMATLQVLGETTQPTTGTSVIDRGRRDLRILMVDHEDSFVHCLADYFRQTGAEVLTYRTPAHLDVLESCRPDLLVLSPGPGRPSDFGVAATLANAEALGIPVFGVCLGLQGMVEYFGGRLSVLARPCHGRASTIRVTAPQSRLLDGMPPTFEVGRYHSLYAKAADVPPVLQVSAVSDDGIAMIVEHGERPLAAVQFHPESIMTAGHSLGHRIIANAVAALSHKPAALR